MLLLNAFIFITASGAALGAIRKWIWPFIKGLVEVIDTIPILIDIGNEFKPNEGASLRDRIDAHSVALDNIQHQLENLLTKEA